MSVLALCTINKDDKARNFLKNIRYKSIKSVEPKASASKVAQLKAFTKGTLAITDNKMPLIGAIQYSNKFGLDPIFVEKNPKAEIREIAKKKKK